MFVASVRKKMTFQENPDMADDVAQDFFGSSICRT
jgi:hypothetical protein